MKKYSIYTVLVALACMVSCSDFLEAPLQSSKGENDMFSDPTLTEGAIMAIYSQMGENRSYRNRLIGYMGVNTDIEVHSGSKDGTASSSDRKTMAVYLQSKALKDGFNDTEGKDPWSQLYTAIEKANLCIDGIREYGNPSENAEMAYFLGEALTLRAMFYFDLIKFWGDVPARFKALSTETLYVGKTDRDEIYKQILADLGEASQYVPWPGQTAKTSTVERINKAFVKGLRARVALSAAGFSMRPLNYSGNIADTKVETSVSKIIRTASDAYRKELYEIARQECHDIIEGEGKNTAKLIGFEEFFRNQCQDVVSAGKESLFEIPFSNSRGEYMSYLGLRHEGDNISKGVDKYTTIVIKSEVNVTPSFFFDYNQGDLRRDITVLPMKWVDGQKQMTGNVSNFYLAKWRPEWAGRVFSSNDDGINFCVMRYADVLLMYAEAVNELEASPANALPYLKQVRERAFGGVDRLDLVAAKYPNYATDKAEFFQAIVDERAFEFCGENIRKWDLIRWGILKDKMEEAQDNLQALLDRGVSAGGNSYSDVPESVAWRNRTADTDSDNPEVIEMYGLNRGEDDINSKTEAAGWKKKKDWIKASPETAGSEPYLTTIKNALFKGDPNERQLLPIMDIVIVGSQGSLYNDYNY